MADDERAALEPIRAAFAERSKLIARKSKWSVLRFAVAAVVAALFLKGMPLHYLFVPLGQIIVLFTAYLLWMALFDCVILLSDWFGQRKLDRIFREE